jgi:hypothetical protein
MERASTLTIDRWSSVYSVPSDHPDPEDLRARLDRLVSAQVIDACRRRLAPLVNESDPSVWLIRRVDLDLILDASAFAADQTGCAWGEQLAVEIRQILDGGPSGDVVLHFRDSAAFVAQWVRDTAAGRTAGKWYYAEFDSLGSLPPGAAIAEAVVRSDDATEILLRLQEQGVLEAVLIVLSTRDAQRLGDRVLPRAGVGRAVSTRWVARALAIWNGIALSRGDGDDARDALRLFVAAKSEWPGGSAEDDVQLREVLDGLLELRRALALFDSGERALAYLRAVISRDEKSAAALAPDALWTLANVTGFVRSASCGDAAWAQCVVSVLAPPAIAQQKSDESSFLSELGGIFHLATAFVDLGIDEALRAAAQACDEPLRAEPVLRYLLAMRCMGRERAALSVGDPAIAVFANLQRAPSLADLAEIQIRADAGAALRIVLERWTESTGGSPDEGLSDGLADYFFVGSVFPDLQLEAERERAWAQMAAMALRKFARRLPGFAKSSPDYLFRNFLSGTCQLRVAADRIEIRMGQSPLAVVLRMAGAYQTVTLPWREGVEICLLAPTG